jgi:hypothetical protein
MGKFKIGDRVVALTNPKHEHSQPRIKGKIYTVQDILYCSNCGIQLINISGLCDFNYLLCECGSRCENYKQHWTTYKHFAKVDDLSSALEEAIENEDYELASMLNELMKEVELT